MDSVKHKRRVIPLFACLIIKINDMEEQKGCVEGCPHCKQREEESQAQEEMSLAVLLALVPMLVMTLFSNIGIL